MNSGGNSHCMLGESSSSVQTLDNGEAIRQCVYSRAQNSSFLKLKRLVLVQIANACRLGAFVLFLFGLVGVGTICVAIGILNIKRCPLQKYLPIYLIAEGVLMLVALPHVVLASGRTPVTNSYSDVISFLYKVILCACEICILILGTFVVYGAVPPNFDPVKGPHCSKICFLAAFSLVTTTWLFILVLLLFTMLLMCCYLLGNSNPRIYPRTSPA